jgi:MFS family permease
MKRTRYRWFVVAIFFLFMLLHQSDKLLLGSLVTPVMEDFGINEAQMGIIWSGAFLVGAILYPIWGYFYDRFARAKLLALASFIWGSTTWLGALAPTYPTFVAARAATGIDDSSYPGLYSLISDYFGPRVRGKVYGVLQITAPVGFMLGMVLALTLKDSIGWRGVFYLTGSLGILLSVVIFFGVREVPRGRSEPELAGLEEIGIYRFDWQTAKGLFRKRSLLILFVQGFFGVFPWQIISTWFVRYLETERNYEANAIMITMSVAVLCMAAGYTVGGAAGDALFRRTRSGRILVAATGVLLGAIFLAVAFNVSLQSQILFGVTVSLAAFFMPFASPNVISSVYDITLPEVRSTALGVQYLLESAGAWTAPALAGLIAVSYSLKTAFLVICITAWLLCAIFFGFVGRMIPNDIEALREQMRQRAEEEAAAPSKGSILETA